MFEPTEIEFDTVRAIFVFFWLPPLDDAQGCNRTPSKPTFFLRASRRETKCSASVVEFTDGFFVFLPELEARAPIYARCRNTPFVPGADCTGPSSRNVRFVYGADASSLDHLQLVRTAVKETLELHDRAATLSPLSRRSGQSTQ